MYHKYIRKLLKYAAALEKRKYVYIYRNIFIFIYCHLAGLYGLYLGVTSAKWATIVLGFTIYILAALGITAGAHRLWSHETYKAKLPLQILLIIFNSFSFDSTVIDWVRDHRLYHKYSDSDKDLSSPTTALFLSQFRWLMVRRNSLMGKRGKLLDMSDILSNPVLRFQKRYALPLNGIIGVVLPTILPMYFWGESFNNAWHLTMLRFITNLNETFLMNSEAHKYSYTPHDKATEIIETLRAISFGKGFLNYHHCYPFDYRATEFGNNLVNLTTVFIDFFAWIGWAHDLKMGHEKT